MQKKIFGALALIMIFAACSSQPPAKTAGTIYDKQALGEFLKDTTPGRLENQYLVGVGDKLDVVFFFHENLTTRNLMVRSDGRITLPYVGDVMAAGRRPMHLDSTLTARYSEILRDPNLSVIVRETPDHLVYVLGKVDRPGGYPFQRSLSLVQAISESGGFDRGAKTNHVLVIRREGTEKIVGVEVDVKSILQGKTIHNDFLLKNHDIIFVPTTRIQSIEDFAESLNKILNPPLDLVLRGWQVRLLNQQLELIQQR